MEYLPSTAEERFIAVCVALTGFDSVELTGTGVAALYQNNGNSIIGAGVVCCSGVGLYAVGVPAVGGLP